MIYLFYFYIFMTPLVMYQERFFPKGPKFVNYSNLMVLIMLGTMVMHRSRKERPPVMASPLNRPLVAFLGWTLLGLAVTEFNVSGANALDPGGALFTHFLQFANSFLFFWLGAALLDSRPRMRNAILAMGLAAFPVVRAFKSDFVGGVSYHYNEGMRVSGPFVWIGSNELAAFFTACCLFFLFYSLKTRSWIFKAFFMSVAGLYAYGILYSYSRGSQLAFGLAVGVATFIRHRLAIVVLVIAALSSSYWLPASVVERWQMTKSDSGELDESAESRTHFWGVAWDLFLRNPVMGTGVGSFQRLSPYKMDTHNIWMRILSEQGAVGFGLFVWMWLVILKMNYRLWREADNEDDRHYGFCVMITTIGLMAANVFGDRFTHLPVTGHYWVLVGISARLYARMTGVEALDAEELPEVGNLQVNPEGFVTPGMVLPVRGASAIIPENRSGVPGLVIVGQSLTAASKQQKMEILGPNGKST